MHIDVKHEDLKSLKGKKEKVYGVTFGSLYLISCGDVHIQCFKRGKEGFITYGIINYDLQYLNDDCINLNEPIGVNFDKYLEFSKEENKVIDKFY